MVVPLMVARKQRGPERNSGQDTTGKDEFLVTCFFRLGTISKISTISQDAIEL